MNKKVFCAKKFVGERALFMSHDLNLKNCIFVDGESHLKESKNILLDKVCFQWKYPLWYCDNIHGEDCIFFEMARAGIWYSKNIFLKNCLYEAPKGFRKSMEIKLENIDFKNALETLWNCKNIVMKDIFACGDYFCMNSQNIKIKNLNLAGNYGFDGCDDLEIYDSKILSKDIFWNCKNVKVFNSYISGEYLAWNSENVYFENCIIESHQGFCYAKNLVLKNCRLLNTDLAFEYSDVNAEIIGEIESVKNPASGIIKADFINNLILEKDKVDLNKIKIIFGDNKKNV